MFKRMLGGVLLGLVLLALGGWFLMIRFSSKDGASSSTPGSTARGSESGSKPVATNTTSSAVNGVRPDEASASPVDVIQNGTPGAVAPQNPPPPSVSQSSSPNPSDVPPGGKMAAPSVWERLDNPKVLATELRPQPDGAIRRAQLVRVDSKYPLVVFEGTLPGGDASAGNAKARNVTVKVADHVIVRPADGVSDADFRRAVQAAGLTVGDQLAPEGPYLVQLPDASIAGVDNALQALQKSGAAAYAEPDFLVHASDIPRAKMLVDMVGDVATFPEMALDANTIRPPDGPVFDAVTQAASVAEGLASLPGGARILTFDSPSFLGGPGSYNPYLQEQNFRVSTDGGAYVQGTYTADYPNNGTNYLRSLLSESNLTIKHQEGLPFTILRVDLSEFSTNFASPKAITFTGYKAGGGTVSQTFVTDGVIDGSNSADDFETFTFGSNFNNLTKVVVSTSLYMIDNIAVLVEGQETAPPAPPVPPLVYEVTWDAPKHTIDALPAVSGPDAPSSINFGTPTVRAQVGTLSGPVLELKGTDYQQIRFGVRQNAQAYRLEFDAYIDLPTDFTIHFDGAGGVQALYFKSDGSISAFQSYISTPPKLGTYPVRQKIQIAVAIDMAKPEWEVFVDGVSKYRGRFDVSGGDLRDIRFHESGSSTGSVGVDNIRIYAYGTENAPTVGPRLSVSPPTLSFPSLPLGTTQTWSLGLYNSGTQTLNVQEIASTNSQFTVPGSYPVSILPGGYFYAAVNFTPQSIGPASASLNIVSNDSKRPTVAVPVFGSGIGIPSIALSPANLQVTMLANTIGTQTFTLGNSGAANLSWNLVLKGISTQPGVPDDPSRTPNDALFSSLWAMGLSGAGRGGIDAVHAWSVTTGSAANVIAVIDTGVDLTHPELQGNLWVNTGEIPGNGIDDDHNGYIDDVNGWDFFNRDNNPSDGHGHGTHVAGTIAARGNNALGVAGVCWNAQILPIKFLSDSGSGYTSDAVSALSYAQRMSARISNNSWGGGGYSQALYDAIRVAGQSGSLFVAAAGNDSADNDGIPQYPSSFDLDCIVAVASTDQTDTLSYFSNYGVQSVDLAAPGSGILSLRPGGQFAVLSGTSMATPHVTGAAALLLSQNPTLTPAQIKPLLLFGADSLASLGNRVASQGRLNAYRALKATVPRWLQPSLTSGVVPPGQTVQVPLSVNTTSLSPGTYIQTIAVSSNDPARRTVDLPVVLKVIPATGYAQWLVSKFTTNQMLANTAESTLWSDTADPDGDRMSNLLEFITGGDPNLAEPENVPKMVSSNGENVFEFQIRESLFGASYQVEWSPSLATPAWQTAGLVVVEDTTVGTPSGFRKLRLKVTPTPPAAFFRMVGINRSGEGE